MSALSGKGGNRAPDWINLVLGIALFVSPWVLGYSDGGSAVWNACYSGALVAVFAFFALANFAPWNEWASALAGVWIVIAPWILDFTATLSALWTHLVVGVVVAAMAGWRSWDTLHGGTGTDTHAHA